MKVVESLGLCLRLLVAASGSAHSKLVVYWWKGDQRRMMWPLIRPRTTPLYSSKSSFPFSLRSSPLTLRKGQRHIPLNTPVHLHEKVRIDQTEHCAGGMTLLEISQRASSSRDREESERKIWRHAYKKFPGEWTDWRATDGNIPTVTLDKGGQDTSWLGCWVRLCQDSCLPAAPPPAPQQLITCKKCFLLSLSDGGGVSGLILYSSHVLWSSSFRVYLHGSGARVECRYTPADLIVYLLV